jgi:hypothetical protein
MVAQYGVDIFWEKNIGGAYSPATGKTSGASIVNYALKGHVRGYRPHEISGLLEYGDKELRLAASDVAFEMMEGDRVLIDGGYYHVVAIDRRMNALIVVQLRGIS